MSTKSFAAACFVLIISAVSIVQTAHSQSAEEDYARLLKTYVAQSKGGVNLVDYAGWKQNSADRDALRNYLRYLKQQRPSQMSRNDAHVFWVNLYNAATLNVVLESYPVESIRDIASEGAGLFDFKAFFGPWRSKLTEIEGKKYSLDDIEHNIIRPTFQDARSHYALNCASMGCPNLMRTPWRAETLEADLDAAAVAFVNHPRGVTVAPDGGLFISSIYDWFKEDFGGSDQAVVAHLKQYAKPELAAVVKAQPRINGHNYDWTLNEQLARNAVR